MEWSLSSNDSMLAYIDIVGINVMVRGFFEIAFSQEDTILVECHNVGVPVVDEMFWIDIELLEVVLGLGHVLHYLELGRCIPLHLVNTKALEIEGLPYFADEFALLFPLH